MAAQTSLMTDITVLQRMTNYLNSLHGDAFQGRLNEQLTEHMRTAKPTSGLTSETVLAYLSQAQKRSSALGKENEHLDELKQDREAKQRERDDARTRREREAMDAVLTDIDQQLANKRRKIDNAQTDFALAQQTLADAHEQARERRRQSHRQQRNQKKQDRQDRKQAGLTARHEEAQRVLAEKHAATEKAQAAAAEAAASAGLGARRVNVKAAEYNRANKREERALQALRAAAQDRIQALSIAVLEADLRQRGVPIPPVSAAALQDAVSEEKEREQKGEELAQQD